MTKRTFLLKGAKDESRQSGAFPCHLGGETAGCHMISGAGLCWQHVGGVGSTTTTTTFLLIRLISFFIFCSFLLFFVLLYEKSAAFATFYVNSSHVIQIYYLCPRYVFVPRIAEDLGSNPCECQIFYLFRCVISSLLPLRSIGRSKFDKVLHNYKMLILKRHIIIVKINETILQKLNHPWAAIKTNTINRTACR